MLSDMLIAHIHSTRMRNRSGFIRYFNATIRFDAIYDFSHFNECRHFACSIFTACQVILHFYGDAERSERQSSNKHCDDHIDIYITMDVYVFFGKSI